MVDLRIVICRPVTALALLVTVLSSVGLCAESTTITPEAAKALIREAYGKTETAQSLEDYAEVIQICQRAAQADLEKEANDYVYQLLGWGYNRRGELYAEQAATLAEQGNKDQAAQADALAAAEFQTACELNPGYWKALHNRGVSLALSGKLTDAIADFTRVVELKPDYANAWFNLGEIHYEQGDFTTALNDYTQAVQLSPEDSAARLRRGHANFQMRRFRDALADYNRAVEMEPDTAEPLINRGDAYRKLGQWKEAAEDYRTALRADNDSARAYRCAAWMMATCPDDQYRDTELAVQAAANAIRLAEEPGFEYYDTMAAAYAEAGNFEQAVGYVNKALEIVPPVYAPALQQRLAKYQAKQAHREQVDSAAERTAEPNPDPDAATRR